MNNRFDRLTHSRSRKRKGNIEHATHSTLLANNPRILSTPPAKDATINYDKIRNLTYSERKLHNNC